MNYHQCEETADTVGENICKVPTGERTTAKIYKEPQKFNNCKTNQPVIKSAKHRNRYLSKDEIQWVTYTKSMLKISGKSKEIPVRLHLPPVTMV